MTKYERLRDSLKSTGQGQMKAFGTSMLPIIKSASAVLTYEKQDSYEVGMTVIPARKRPHYVRLVRPEDLAEPEPYYRVDSEQGSGGEDVVLVIISRNPRLLEELRARMIIRKTATDELTFIIRQNPIGRRNSTLFPTGGRLGQAEAAAGCQQQGRCWAPPRTALTMSRISLSLKPSNPTRDTYTSSKPSSDPRRRGTRRAGGR